MLDIYSEYFSDFCFVEKGVLEYWCPIGYFIAYLDGIQHYSDVIMSAMASQITGIAIAYSTVYSGADQRKHQSSESLAFVWGIHRWPVNSPHKWSATRKMFPFDDVIMDTEYLCGRIRRTIWLRTQIKNQE